MLKAHLYKNPFLWWLPWGSHGLIIAARQSHGHNDWLALLSSSLKAPLCGHSPLRLHHRKFPTLQSVSSFTRPRFPSTSEVSCTMQSLRQMLWESELHTHTLLIQMCRDLSDKKNKYTLEPQSSPKLSFSIFTLGLPHHHGYGCSMIWGFLGIWRSQGKMWRIKKYILNVHMPLDKALGFIRDHRFQPKKSY